jgi:hypothetical protein
MATYTVNPGGGADYTSLNAALLAHEGTLTENLIINCSGSTADTTPVVSTSTDGYVCGSYSVTINGDNTTGKYSTSYYRLEVSNADALQISSAGFVVNGLQIKVTLNSSNDKYGIALGYPGTIKNCIIMASASNYSSGWGINCWQTSAGTTYIFNNIVYDWIEGTRSYGGIYVNDDTGSKTYNIYSNTVYGNYVGISNYYGTYGTVNLKNNLCNGNTAYDYLGTWDTTATNLSEDATSPQVSLRSKAVTFVGEASSPRDLHLSSGDTNAKDAGTDTSGEGAPLNFTTDIDGQTRTGSWDIGADEYVAGGGGFTSGGSLKTVVIEW